MSDRTRHSSPGKGLPRTGSPAVHRLRAWFVRMSFRTKFLVVGVLVAGPLCALAGYAAAQFHQQVESTQLRSEALERATRARELIEALALHRGLSASVLAGGEGLSSQLVAQQSQVMARLETLLEVLPVGSAARSDLPRADALAAEVRALLQLPDAMEPLRNFERHNAVIDQLIVMMVRTGTRGATSNGPQAAGAYELAFVALPALVEALGRQRGWGSAVLQQSQFSDDEVARHLMHAGAAGQRIELLRADRQSIDELDRLFDRAGLQLDAALTEAEVFSQRSIALVYGRDADAEAAPQHFAEGTTAMAGVLDLARRLTDTLQARTAAEQQRAEQLRLASLGALALVILSLALIYREFERTTVLRLKRLTHASTRLARGEFDDSVSVEGSDEIATLADALDGMRLQLRDAVAQRAQAMAARESERERTAFLARWSHDLRTPLAAVLGFARLLSERDSANLSSGQRADLARIETAASHLLGLVDDVLALSTDQLREAAPRRDALDAAVLVREACDLVVGEARHRGVDLRPQLPEGLPLLAGDRTRMLQVLGNLLSNAIKFNRPQGWVVVQAWVAADTLNLEVSDSGIGFNAEQRDRLFQPFERLSAESRGVPGTGLGLVTARRLVEAMGGTIGAEGQPGQGARFTVSMPLAQAGPPSGASAAEAGAATTDIELAVPSGVTGTTLVGRVAYVEDNPTNAELLKAMAALRTQLEVQVFPDGASALASSQSFDLWIIDHELPDTDGIALLAELRRRQGAVVQAVLFTADALPGRERDALAAGFAERWVKPIALDDFEAGLGRLLPGR